MGSRLWTVATGSGVNICWRRRTANQRRHQHEEHHGTQVNWVEAHGWRSGPSDVAQSKTSAMVPNIADALFDVPFFAEICVGALGVAGWLYKAVAWPLARCDKL